MITQHAKECISINLSLLSLKGNFVRCSCKRSDKKKRLTVVAFCWETTPALPCSVLRNRAKQIFCLCLCLSVFLVYKSCLMSCAGLNGYYDTLPFLNEFGTFSLFSCFLGEHLQKVRLNLQYNDTFSLIKIEKLRKIGYHVSCCGFR